MKIEWIKNNKNESFVTVYENNITFKKNIACKFEDALGVAIGIDKEEQKLIVKKITEKNKNILDQANLYKLDHKPSYVRLNSKKIVELINLISDNKNKIQSSYRYKASWDETEEMLLIDAKEEIKYE